MERDLIFHTQEVTGSSPVAPTIHFKQIQTEGTGGESCCDVDCDVKSQFAFLDSAGSLPRAHSLDRFPVFPAPSASRPCARGCSAPAFGATCGRRRPSR